MTVGGVPHNLGADDGDSGSGWEPTPTSTSPNDGSEDGEPPPGGETTEPPVGGMCETDADCVVADPAPCEDAQGTCEFENCFYDPLPTGTPCDGGACDETGACVPSEVECDEGLADCNGDAADGCEADLSSPEHCGTCNNTCPSGDNVESTVCNAGACEITCAAPYEDCDGDPSNGCEIPTGIPNQCDVDGLNPDGCWTAHCGSSTNADARNFGTWYCFECTNCTEPLPGFVQWCSHSSGLWFPLEAGSCVVDSVDYLDLVCSP